VAVARDQHVVFDADTHAAERDRNGVVVWRGGNTPIDLSKQVSQGIRATFPPGSFLVISEADPGCTPIGAQDIFGPMPGLTGPIPGVAGMSSGMTASRPAR
jgi:hypothetical protein